MLSAFGRPGKRSAAEEWMDRGDFSEKDMRSSFKVIAFVNRFLGGHRVVLDALAELLRGWPAERPVQIADIGCGMDTVALRIRDFGERNGLDIRYTGVDRNDNAVRLAQRAAQPGRIRYIRGDILDPDLPDADIVIASAILHHLDGNDLPRGILNLFTHSRHAVIINDLLRSPFAYWPAFLLTRCIVNTAARRDGLLSIRKGFVPHEMEQLFAGLGLSGSVRSRYLYRLVAIVRKQTGQG